MKWTRIAGFGAAGLLFVIVAWIVHEARKPPAPRDTGKGSLTDVAPSARATLTGPTAPSFDPGVKGALLPPAPVVLPSAMPDPAHPPRWTDPLAMPGTPVPPDPFVPPAMSVDPTRGRADAGP